MTTLRDYQLRAVNLIEADLARHGSTLCVMPTGTGKTTVFAELVRRHARRGVASLIVAHRDELIRQAAARVEADANLAPEIEMGECYVSDLLAPLCVVSSVQTLSRLKRLSRFPRDRFGLLVVDEAHHAVARTYRDVIAHFCPAANLLGVTATPKRADEGALGQVFASVACNYSLEWGVSQGWLVPVLQRIIQLDNVDFSRCRTVAGDFNQQDLDDEMSRYEALHGVAAAVTEQAPDEQGIVFCVSVKQAQALAARLNRYREGCAAWVCGETHPDERKKIIGAFRSGAVQHLVNVGIATEGFDHDAVGVVVMARPTKSLSLYLQMIGRATRPLKGVVDGPEDAEARIRAILASRKPHCRVLDFVGASSRHSLKQITCADALGGDYAPQVRQAARQLMEEAALTPAQAVSHTGQPMTAEDYLALARDELALLAEEEERRKRIKAEVSYRVQDAEGVGATHAPQNAPQAREPATPRQIARLVSIGWQPQAAEKLSKKQAGAIIGRHYQENGREAA